MTWVTNSPFRLFWKAWERDAKMAPQLPGQALGHLLHSRAINTTSPETVMDYLYVHWHDPGDILSLLLILGPEVVQNADAQLTGRVVTPIAFSFGWVTYAVSVLLSTVGGKFTVLSDNHGSITMWRLMRSRWAVDTEREHGKCSCHWCCEWPHSNNGQLGPREIAPRKVKHRNRNRKLGKQFESRYTKSIRDRHVFTVYLSWIEFGF